MLTVTSLQVEKSLLGQIMTWKCLGGQLSISAQSVIRHFWHWGRGTLYHPVPPGLHYFLTDICTRLTCVLIKAHQRYLTTSSYKFYKVVNSYDLTRTILYDLSEPQWRVGLGARSFVQIHTNCATRKIRMIWQKKTYEFIQVRSYEFVWISHLVKYVRIAVISVWIIPCNWLCDLSQLSVHAYQALNI